MPRRFFSSCAFTVLLSIPDPAVAQECLEPPDASRWQGTLPAAETIGDVEFVGNFAYGIAADGLHVYDVVDPTRPVWVTSDSTIGTPGGRIARSGDFLYVGGDSVAVQVVDVSTPSTPEARARRGGGGVQDLAVVDGVAFLVQDNFVGLVQFDVSDPDALPAPLGGTLSGERFDRVWAQGAHLLAMSSAENEISSLIPGAEIRSDIVPVAIASSGMGLKVDDRIYVFGNGGVTTVDVSDPTSMSVLHSELPIPLGSLEAGVGNRVYGYGISFGPWVGFDLTDPSSSVPLAPIPVLGVFGSGVGIIGETLYVSGGGGLSQYDLGDTTIDPSAGRIDLDLRDSPSLAVDAGLAVIGDGGLRWIDVSDVASPVDLGTTDLGALSFYAVEVDGSYVYAARGDSFVVYDATDPAQPALVRTVAYPQGRSGRAMTIADDLLFAVSYGDSSAITAFDLTDPSAPTPRGTLVIDGIINSVAADAKLVAYRKGLGAYGVVDFGDPDGPVGLTEPGFGLASVDVAIEGELVLIGDRSSASLVDVTVPGAPVLVADLPLPAFGSGQSVGSVALSNGLAYVNSVEGLVLFDVSDPAIPVLVGLWEVFRGELALTPNGVFVAGADGFEIVRRPCDDGSTVSTLVTAVSTSIGRSSVSLEWSLVGLLGDVEFRVTAVRDDEVWNVPLRTSARGRVVAVDVSPRLRDGGVVRYELAMRRGPSDWLMIDQVDVVPTGARIRSVLDPATPNPFNPRTRLRFEIAVAGEVELAIFDTAGRRVRTLLSGVRGVGSTEIVWDGTDDGGRLVASGTYVARLRTLDGTRSQKLTLVR